MVQSPPRTNPFPGLRPFELDEEHLFFGREGQADELLTRLNRTRFLAVVGTSGSGKSSLVRAGLLPSLYSGLMQNASSGWRVAILRPGSAPMGNLAAALNDQDVFGVDSASDDAVIRTALTESTLRRGALGLVEVTQQARMAPHENLLVVVDQFEELFRFKTQAQAQNRRLEAEDEAAAFVKLLLGAVNQWDIHIFVALTMRSDFLGDCAQFRDLPETLNDSQYLIPRLTREQLRSAIAGPVAVGGATITPRLVNRLLNDTGDNPDQLPILQHALMRTWDHWEDQGQSERAINIEDYEAVGGMAAALSRHADQIYDGLPDNRARYIAKTLFKRLTDRGSDNRDIRRPTTLAEICAVANASEAEVIAVADEFRGARRSFLMPPAGVALRSDTVIDISHESLMRNWQRLGEWLAEETQSALIYKRLAETATMHDQGTAGYWRDPELTIGLTWLKEQQPTKAWAERYAANFDEAVGFLEASAETRDTEAAEKEKSRRREVTRLRTFLALLGGLSLLTGGAAVYAFNQQQEAREQTQIALAQEQKAEEQRNIAVQEKRSAEDARQEAYEQRDLARRLTEESQEAQKTAQMQRIAAVRAQEAELQQRRTAEDALLRAEEGEAQARHSANIAKTEAIRANLSAEEAQNERARARSEAQRAETSALNSSIQSEAYKIENLLSTGFHLEANLRAMRLIRDVEALHQYDLNSFAYSGTDRRNSLAQQNSRPFYDQRSAVDPALRMQITSILRKALYRQGFTERNVIQTHRSNMWRAIPSPDRKLIASSHDDGSIRLWDTSGNELKTLVGPTFSGDTNEVTDISFSPDGLKLASSSQDGTVRLWSLDDINKTDVKIFSGHNHEVYSVAFSPDGKKLASGSRDLSIIVWDLEGNIMQTLRGHTETIFSLAFSPDGKTLIAAGGDRIKLWDQTGHVVNELSGHEAIIDAVAVSHDGNLIASGSRDGVVKIWSLDEGEINSFKMHSFGIKKIQFSPSDQLLASAGTDSVVKIFNAQGRVIQDLRGHRGFVNGVEFSSDDDLISAGEDKKVRLWRLKGLAIERAENSLNSPSFRKVKFSSDGSFFVGLDDSSSMAVLWDRNRMQRALMIDHLDVIRSVDISPDSNLIATASTDKTVKIWNRSGGLRNTIYGYNDFVLRVVFSPDGKYIASSSGDGSIKLHNTEGELIHSIYGSDKPIQALNFSPDGRYLASADDDGIAKMWDVENFSNDSQEPLIFSFQLHLDWINDIVFSPMGNAFATASRDGTAKLWSLDGQKLADFEGHASSVKAVKFSPDGSVLATVSNDLTTKIWNPRGFEIQTLEGHTNYVNDLDFSPDGSILATASGDGNIFLWNLNLDDLMVKSCDWLRDYMANPTTPSEEKALCEGYLPPVLLQSPAPGPLHWVANVRAFVTTTLTRS